MSNYTAPGTIGHAASISYAEWVKLQATETVSINKPVSDQVSTDGSSQLVETKLACHEGMASGHDPHLTQIIEYRRSDNKTTKTQVDVTFQKHNGGMRACFTIKPIDHHRSPAAVDYWMRDIHKIVKGSKLPYASADWLDESKICFLKAATLSNRVDEVFEHYGCTETMRNEAYAWAKQHGIVHKRSWTYSDEITVDDGTLSFTLQKWEGVDPVACVQSSIVGKSQPAIQRLSNILLYINRIGAGHHIGCSDDILAKVAVFGDMRTIYEWSKVTPTAEHRELAEKYGSTDMLAYFASHTAQKWNVVNYGQTYTLIKQSDLVITNPVFDRTIEMLSKGNLQLDQLSGSPQVWAEIAAFANFNTTLLNRIIAFAKQIDFDIDMARVDAAAAAGKA